MTFGKCAKQSHIVVPLNQQAIVGRNSFNDHRSQFIAVLGEKFLQCVFIIERQYRCLAGDRFRYSRR